MKSLSPTFAALEVFGLTGDMAVMIQEPQPPANKCHNTLYVYLVHAASLADDLRVVQPFALELEPSWAIR